MIAPVDWDQQSHCVDCARPATHRRLYAYTATIDAPVYELVCCHHAHEPKDATQ